ncbi:hypothetical protein APB02_33235 [Pseudomonas aeruginosa]|nr:hypothetical protein APB02_33235 [Pseudomonas aeruginosa]PBX12895.1 hypothetical protein CJT86_09340 [Pseudomonas aeruginosa]PCA73496.1 hypothetical protein CJU08_14700 [Pseudomonas aeruginosa]
MCGISGFIQRHTEKSQMVQIIGQMTDKIIHRGPDDKGRRQKLSATPDLSGTVLPYVLFRTQR